MKAENKLYTVSSQNSKFEIRNPKQIPVFKFQIFKQLISLNNWNLGFKDCLVFRISVLEFQ